MLNRFNRDADLICCPISRQKFRHPVMASDGRRYELNELLKLFRRNQRTSPFTGERISSVTYDNLLKSSLDDSYSNDDDRYEDYTHHDALNELASLVNQYSVYRLPRQATEDSEESLSFSATRVADVIYASKFGMFLSIIPYMIYFGADTYKFNREEEKILASLLVVAFSVACGAAEYTASRFEIKGYQGFFKAASSLISRAAPIVERAANRLMEMNRP